jgi:hypothetical protein
LKSLLEDVVKKSNGMDKDKTVVHHPTTGGSMWQRALAKPNRPISTVILDEEQKSRIVADIEEYSLPSTEKWYANRGLQRSSAFHTLPPLVLQCGGFFLFLFFPCRYGVTELPVPGDTPGKCQIPGLLVRPGAGKGQDGRIPGVYTMLCMIDW